MLEIAKSRDLAEIDIAMVIALGIEGRVLAPWDEAMSNVPVVAMRPDGMLVSDNPVYSDDEYVAVAFASRIRPLERDDRARATKLASRGERVRLSDFDERAMELRVIKEEPR
jgi:hypothetical protein